MTWTPINDSDNPAPRDVDAPPILAPACFDCGLSYDNPCFQDLVITDAAWKIISPDGEGNGLLCPNCICARLVKAGITTTGRFTSGPLSQ